MRKLFTVSAAVIIVLATAVSAQVRQSYFERSADTINLIQSMTDEDRLLMTEGDRLTPAFENAMDAGRYHDAVEIAERQLEIRQRLLDARHPELIPTLIGHGFASWKQSRFAEGEQSLRLAREIIAEHLDESHPEMARCIDLLGLCRMARGFHNEAKQLFFQALDISLETCGENHELAIACYDDLGAVHQEQSDLVRSEPFRRKALALSRTLNGTDHVTTARLSHNLAKLLMRTGDHQDAEALLREALDCRMRRLGKEHPDVAFTMDHLAEALTLMKRFDDAEPYARSALEINRNTLGENHRHTAFSLSRLASLCYQRGDLDNAIRYNKEALDTHRRVYGSAHPNVVRSFRDLAIIYIQIGDYDSAERCLFEMRSQLSEPALTTFTGWYTDYYLGRIAMLRGQYQLAEEILSGITDGFETARSKASALDRRATFIADGNPYLNLASVRLLLNKNDQAWPAAERYLGRGLLDILKAYGETILTPGEAAREDSLKSALTALEQRLEVLNDEANNDNDSQELKTKIETARTQLLETQAQWCAFRTDMQLKYRIAEGEVFTLDRVQAALDDHTAIVGWLDFSPKPRKRFAWAYVIRSQGPVEWAQLFADTNATDESDIDLTPQAFRQSLTGAASWPYRVTSTGKIEWMARELYDRRFAPIEKYLNGVTDLVVIPTGAMQGLPVEAIIDSGGNNLGDRFTVSYTSSASVYAWLRERGARENDQMERALIIGDPLPVTSGEYAAPTSLPAGGLEVSSVASLFTDRTLRSGKRASEPELVQLAPTIDQFDVVHVATHATIDPERPERSYLALSAHDLPDALECAMTGERIYDDRLTANEIVREWKLDADLVTLSACETALGKNVRGEGFVGFAHAFLQSGARSVVVSLWEVDDEATARLMKRFYENLTGEYSPPRLNGKIGPLSKADALREAKHWLRNYQDESGLMPFRHPSYWSAFVLIGDPG